MMLNSRRFLSRSAAPALVLCFAAVATSPAAEPDAVSVADPYLFIIRDPDLHRELKLSADEVSAVRSLTDELDGPLWASRNEPAGERLRLQRELAARARRRMERILPEKKRQRLFEIVLQAQGTRALLRDDVARRLSLSGQQDETIREIIARTGEEVGKLSERKKELSRDALQKRVRELRDRERRRIVNALSRDQLLRWRRLAGRRVDASRFRDDLAFKAPEFRGPGPWINSEPLSMQQLRGRVVVVHFYAFG